MHIEGTINSVEISTKMVLHIHKSENALDYPNGYITVRHSLGSVAGHAVLLYFYQYAQVEI